MKFLKMHLSSIVLGFLFFAGAGLLAYPTFSNWWNSWNAGSISAGYSKALEQMDTASYDELLKSAQNYNETLLHDPGRFDPDEEDNQIYQSMLSVDGSSAIGMVEVPAVKISLPIYHGTDDTVLQVGSGHLQGSSLPIGGKGTHAVLTGHRGLPSAKLFTDLDKVKEGDLVLLKVLRQTLTYEVDEIRIVTPNEIEGLKIEQDKDLLTLVTCTPYGVNSHRMLVTAHRVANQREWQAVSDAMQIDSKRLLCVWPFRF